MSVRWCVHEPCTRSEPTAHYWYVSSIFSQPGEKLMPQSVITSRPFALRTSDCSRHSDATLYGSVSSDATLLGVWTWWCSGHALGYSCCPWGDQPPVRPPVPATKHTTSTTSHWQHTVCPCSTITSAQLLDVCNPHWNSHYSNNGNIKLKSSSVYRVYPGQSCDCCIQGSHVTAVSRAVMWLLFSKFI